MPTESHNCRWPTHPYGVPRPPSNRPIRLGTLHLRNGKLRSCCCQPPRSQKSPPVSSGEKAEEPESGLDDSRMAKSTGHATKITELLRDRHSERVSLTLERTVILAPDETSGSHK